MQTFILFIHTNIYSMCCNKRSGITEKLDAWEPSSKNSSTDNSK